MTLSRFFVVLVATCIALFVVLLAFNGGYKVGKDIAVRENSRDSR